MYLDYMELREQIIDICKRMWQLGWVAANDGNITVKLDNGTYITTPTGISKGFISPEKLVHIDWNGQILEKDSSYRPSSEIKMHLRCYEERDDVKAVLHAHPQFATAYAVAGIPLDEYSVTEAILTIGSVPIAPYATPSTQEVPDSIAPYLNSHDTILLQNHGALAVGKDLVTAFYRMESLEQYAKISIYAKMLGGARELPQKDIMRLLELRKDYYHIPGKHPGYKKYSNL
ncbi:MAG: class II aldolase/adducin family protein [Ruminiclostridium sp.]